MSKQQLSRDAADSGSEVMLGKGIDTFCLHLVCSYELFGISFQALTIANEAP